MMIPGFRLLPCLMAVAAGTLSARADPAAFAFRDGDTVVMLGNTFVEREGRDGFIETFLTLTGGKSGVRFRNLGWSGDTVDCVARSYFGPPQEGFDRLKADLATIAPTVVLVCYGGVEAFDGGSGMDDFVAGYERLLDMIGMAAPEARIAMISPPPCESLNAPLPDMADENARLALIRDAIRALAERRGHWFADLFAAIGSRPPGKEPLTDNGVHFTPHGYAAIAPMFAAALGWPDAGPVPRTSQADALRALVVAKNRLFFQRWRPQNETYLRGFRKHEQGNNAVEIAMFDPLIANKEAAIETARAAIASAEPQKPQ